MGILTKLLRTAAEPLIVLVHLVVLGVFFGVVIIQGVLGGSIERINDIWD